MANFCTGAFWSYLACPGLLLKRVVLEFPVTGGGRNPAVGSTGARAGSGQQEGVCGSCKHTREVDGGKGRSMEGEPALPWILMPVG